MFFKKLQGIYNPQCFINIPAKRQVINQFMAYNTFLVYQKKTAKGDSVFQQNSVIC